MINITYDILDFQYLVLESLATSGAANFWIFPAVIKPVISICEKFPTLFAILFANASRFLLKGSYPYVTK